jgi:hypothetical protein
MARNRRCDPVGKAPRSLQCPCHPLPAPADFRLAKIFEGKLWLYEFRDWNSVPFEIEGKGPVERTQFGDEEIELRAGPGAHGRLRLNVSHFPKWRATLDTVPIPITSAPAPEVEHSAFMQIELLPGIYHFHYRKNASDYLGTFLCLLAAAGYVLLVNWERIFRAGFPLARPAGSA